MPLCNLAALFAIATTAVSATTDTYSNNASSIVQYNHVDFATVTPFVIRKAGWITELMFHASLLRAGGIDLSILRNNVEIHAQMLRTPTPKSGIVHITFEVPTPVSANDTLSFALHSVTGRAFMADVLKEGLSLVVNFNITELAGSVFVSTDDGQGTTARSYSFSSGALNTSTVNDGATLLGYRIKTSTAYALRSDLNLLGSNFFFSWLNTPNGTEPSDVIWCPIGIPYQNAGYFPHNPDDSWTLDHTSLQTNRLYSAGVVSNSKSAVVDLIFRPPTEVITITNDDNSYSLTNAGSFTSKQVALDAAATGGRNCSGFIRSIELKVDAALNTPCWANLTVAQETAAKNTQITDIFSNLQFLNDGKDATVWKSILLPHPVPVYQPGFIQVDHNCGGASYQAGVRQDTGDAVVAFTIDTFHQ